MKPPFRDSSWIWIFDCINPEKRKIFFFFHLATIATNTPEINLTLWEFCDCHVFVAQSIVGPNI
jgi:hypothetical protein